jgi:hypothetical protein
MLTRRAEIRLFDDRVCTAQRSRQRDTLATLHVYSSY